LHLGKPLPASLQKSSANFTAKARNIRQKSCQANLDGTLSLKDNEGAEIPADTF
jgi:hypothetical protein